MKNENTTPNLTKSKVIEISVFKATGIVATAILASAGASIWGTLSVANTVPFRVEAIENNISKIQQQIDNETSLYMPRELADEKWANNSKDHTAIDKKLDQILQNQQTLSDNQRTLLKEIEK